MLHIYIYIYIYDISRLRVKLIFCGRSLAGIVGSNPPPRDMVVGCLSLVSVVCCQVEVFATG